MLLREDRALCSRTDGVRDAAAADGVDERRDAEQRRVDALALSAATAPLAWQRESPEQVSARHAVAVRAHGLAVVADARGVALTRVK